MRESLGGRVGCGPGKASRCTAAFVLGCERVLAAHQMRGLYP